MGRSSAGLCNRTAVDALCRLGVMPFHFVRERRGSAAVAFGRESPVSGLLGGHWVCSYLIERYRGYLQGALDVLFELVGLGIILGFSEERGCVSKSLSDPVLPACTCKMPEPLLCPSMPAPTSPDLMNAWDARRASSPARTGILCWAAPSESMANISEASLNCPSARSLLVLRSIRR